jgi:hypothetical protein
MPGPFGAGPFGAGPYVGVPTPPPSPLASPTAMAPYGEAPYASTLDDLTAAPSAPASEAHAYIYENVEISLEGASDELYLWENVVAGTPAPHLWYINPTEANPGDTVFIVGTGLGAFQATYNGRIVFGSFSPVPNLWELVGADAAAYGPGRQIVPSQNIVDPEHEVISFTVPQGAISSGVKVSTST